MDSPSRSSAGLQWPTRQDLDGRPRGADIAVSTAVARRSRWGTWLRVLHELTIVAVLFLLYNAGRVAIQGQEGVALRNAVSVDRLQMALRLPSEVHLQRLALDVPHLIEIANRYYVSVHFPLTIAFLVWGFLWRPEREYLWARNLLIVQTFLALGIHLAFPLAPPRMLPHYGFLDTGAIFGPSPYHDAEGSVANQFAAMPSLHIGWAVLIAVVLTRTGPRWLCLLAWTHVAFTVFVVVVTANHWWIDGIVAIGLLGIALVIFPEPGRRRGPRLRVGLRPRVAHVIATGLHREHPPDCNGPGAPQGGGPRPGRPSDPSPRVGRSS